MMKFAVLIMTLFMAAALLAPPATDPAQAYWAVAKKYIPSENCHRCWEFPASSEEEASQRAASRGYEDVHLFRSERAALPWHQRNCDCRYDDY